jgi:hypothetical protein
LNGAASKSLNQFFSNYDIAQRRRMPRKRNRLKEKR